MRRGEDDRHVERAKQLAGQHVDFAQTVDFVAEKLDADRLFALRGGKNFDRVAAHAEFATHKADVIALVADGDETAEQLLAFERQTAPQHDLQLLILGRVAQAVDTGHAGDNNHVAPLKQRTGRAVAEFVDLVVDHRVLFDIDILARDIRLGLIIVIVGNKIFDRVIREKLAELGAELRGKRLVVRKHKRRAVDVGDDVRHRKGLARAGDAEQRLLGQPRLDARGQLIYRVRLIAGRLVRRMQFKFVLLHTGFSFQRVNSRTGCAV